MDVKPYLNKLVKVTYQLLGSEPVTQIGTLQTIGVMGFLCVSNLTQHVDAPLMFFLPENISSIEEV